MNDVAGQASQSERELSAEIEECTDERQKPCQKEKYLAEFPKRFHLREV